MNALDPKASDLAVLQYGDCDYRIVRPGRYVLCAVSGAKIPLEGLRYWNVDRQEAYATATEALARYREVGLGA